MKYPNRSTIDQNTRIETQASCASLWGPSEFTVTGLLKDYDRTARLKEISTPTLFTCGRYDEATPDTTTYYHSMLPGSEIAVLEGASHEHHIERPEQYMHIVRSFIHRAESV